MMLCPKTPKNSPLSRGHNRFKFNAQLKVCDWPANVQCENDNKQTKLPKKQKNSKKRRNKQKRKKSVKKSKKTRKQPNTTPTPPTTPKDSNDIILMKQRVCFQAKGDKPGRFKVRPGGHISRLTITHQRGRLSCDTNTRGTSSRFGCSIHFSGYLGIVVADSSRNLVFPPREVKRLNAWGFYRWMTPEGRMYTENDRQLVFNFVTPYKIGKGVDELFLWYGEDFLNVEEAGNRGRVCARVEVVYN